MPIEVTVSFDKNGQKHVLGQVFPDRTVVIDDYSSGSQKNLVVRVAGDKSSASVYEFPNGAYSNIRWPHERWLPLKSYSFRNLDAILKPGQSFRHPLETKSHVKGQVAMTYIGREKQQVPVKKPIEEFALVG